MRMMSLRRRSSKATVARVKTKERKVTRKERARKERARARAKKIELVLVQQRSRAGQIGRAKDRSLRGRKCSRSVIRPRNLVTRTCQISLQVVRACELVSRVIAKQRDACHLC